MKTNHTVAQGPAEPETHSSQAPKVADDSLAALLEGSKRKSRARLVLVLVGGVLLLAGVGGYVLHWRKASATAARPQYVTEPITKGSLVDTISATGTVEALNTVEVGAEISGRILSLNADFNDTVTQGQVLAEIDPEQLEAALAQAKAQMLAATAQVAEAKATLSETRQAADRATDLAAKGLLSSKELESADAQSVRAAAALQSAKASAALAKAAFDAARSKLSKTEIVSPINGAVLSRQVEVGQTLNAGMQTPVLFVIAEDLKHMRLSSQVDEADIGKVADGQAATFTVDAFPERTFKSSVTAVRNVPTTDQNVVSYEVLLSVDNGDLLLRPGMTASVEIVTERLDDVLLVSNKALRFSPERSGEGFRGPRMPFFGRRGKSSERAEKPQNDREALSKLKANQGILWRPSEKGRGNRPVPVKVDKLASDGIHTAIRSPRIREGEVVIVEQTVQGEQTP